MKSKKIVWAIGSLLIASLIVLALRASHKTGPNAAIDDCNEEPIRVIGIIADTEIRLTKVSCGIEQPYFEMSAHSAEFSEGQSVQNALELSNEDTCEDFENSLYTQQDLIIGCCPLPATQDSGEEREIVYVTKVDSTTGAFDKEDDLNFPNVVGRKDAKTGKFIESPSCMNQKLVVDYAKLKKN